jgi:Zn-finger nucleic acid-binding protein
MEFDATRGCLTCGFCGNVKVLEPDADGVALLGAPTELKCPACGAALEEAAVHDRRVLCCPRCRGLLVGMGTFADAVGLLRSERTGSPEPPHHFDPKDLERKLACPHCGAPMDTHRYGGPGNVALSSCEFCELDWLDHGALRHVVAAPEGAAAEE